MCTLHEYVATLVGNATETSCLDLEEALPPVLTSGLFFELLVHTLHL